jgi:hypothetical protein
MGLIFPTVKHLEGKKSMSLQLIILNNIEKYYKCLMKRKVEFL